MAWVNRIRREALSGLDDEINARLLFLASPKRAVVAEYRPIVRHALMTGRSASAVIDRRDRDPMAW